MRGRGRPFQPGNQFSTGRRMGSRNRQTLYREILDGDGIKIIEQIKELALNADPVAMRLCMERLLPVSKDLNSRFQLPPVETAAGLAVAIAAVARAVAHGRLSPQEGESVARILESQRKMMEAEEFEARLKALEQVRAHWPAEG